MPDAPTFAADEVYDRQIRLWGLEAQSRMQNSRVLFVGMRALQAEVRHRTLEPLTFVKSKPVKRAERYCLLWLLCIGV